jgi:ankyrin repeat protein
MKIISFLNRFPYSPILRFAIIVLAWSIPAFCGEIHDAAKSGDLAKIKALLKDNPGLASSKDLWDLTPLHMAVARSNREVVELLLTYSADVNARDINNRTPLHRAVVFGHKDVAELLLANNADVNVKDNNGSTPLHLAADAGEKDVAELLLTNKADISAKDNDGNTPLHWAEHLRGWNVLRDPISVLSCKEVEKSLNLVVDTGHKDVLELLLNNKADINAKNNQGETPLHFAVKSGFRNLAKLLLVHNADVNAKNNQGETPLHFAVKRCFRDLAKLLRQHGGHE